MATFIEISVSDVDTYTAPSFHFPFGNIKPKSDRFLTSGERLITNFQADKLDKYKKAIQLLDDENLIFIIYDTAYDIGGREIKGWIALYTHTEISILEFWDILSEEIQNAIKNGKA